MRVRRHRVLSALKEEEGLLGLYYIHTYVHTYIHTYIHIYSLCIQCIQCIKYSIYVLDGHSHVNIRYT